MSVGGVSKVYGQQVSMEWDNEFGDIGNIETESQDNTQSWLQTLDRGRVSVMSASSSTNTSRRSSMELELSRGESWMSAMCLD